MMASASTRPASPQAGFALLVLLALIGAGTVGILLAVSHFVPPLAGVSARVDDNLTTVQTAATQAFLRNGAFPATLDAVGAAAGLPVAGDWRRDPWSASQDLDYTVSATGLRLRSTGLDRRLGTADDVQCTVATEGLVRMRQRLRLRLIRAVYVAMLQRQYDNPPSGSGSGNGNGGNGNRTRGRGNRGRNNGGNSGNSGNGNNGRNRNGRTRNSNNGGGGQQGNDHGGDDHVEEAAFSGPSATRRIDDAVAAAEPALPGALQTAVRDFAIARRSWLTATTSERAALTQRMNSAAAVVSTMQATAGWSQPVAMTGAGGLMQRLGLRDARALDGLGHPFLLQATLAVLAAGSDGRGGTDDDM